MTKPMRAFPCVLFLVGACSNSATLLHPSDDGGQPDEADARAPGSDGSSGDVDASSEAPTPDAGDAGETPVDEGDASTPLPGTCQHQAKFIPGGDTGMLKVGDFCDTVSICFAGTEQAQAAQAAHSDWTCNESATADCAAERSCSIHTVHAIEAAELETFCSAFDAAAGEEQATCMVFL